MYAVLTDMEKFLFFRYDGKTFERFEEPMFVPTNRVNFLAGMIDGATIAYLKFLLAELTCCLLAIVSETVFSILLQSYIEFLRAIEARSRGRGNNGDVR